MAMIVTIDPINVSKIQETCSVLMRSNHWLHRYQYPGKWAGEGAKFLGLKYFVRLNKLSALLQGLTPNGKVQLGDNVLDRDRRAGWLLTFHSPQTVNMLYAVAPIGITRQIELSHAQAVRAGLKEVENQVQLAKGPSMIFALFQHCVGFAQTPDLHSRVAAMNFGFYANGHVQTLLGKSVLKCRQSARDAYLQEYQNQLEKRLKLQLEVQMSSFEIVGVPRRAAGQLTQAFGAKRNCGMTTAESWRNLSKTYHSELRERWIETSTILAWSTKQARDLIRHTRSHHKRSKEITRAKSKSSDQSNSHSN